MEIQTRLAAALGSALLATVLSGCAVDDSVPPYSVQDSVDVFAGVEYDYDPLETTTALAEQSLLVVVGTIDRVQEGRIQIVPANTSASEISTIVLVLRDARAVSGSLDERNDGFVYVELPNPGGQESEAYQDGLRAGSRIVAYLVGAAGGEPLDGIDTAILDPDAGRPDGQRLYLPAGPQALILQHEKDEVVWPLIGEQRVGAIEETLPGGDLIAH